MSKGWKWPRCRHCDKPIWWDAYGPGWVHRGASFWCREPDRVPWAEPYEPSIQQQDREVFESTLP